MNAITVDGSPDTTAILHVTVRIWTPQPGTNRTTSQTFPVVPLTSINSQSATVFEMGDSTHPDRYLMNLGIANLDPVASQKFSIAWSSGLAGVPCFDVVRDAR
jgi:hypothetical protein